MAGSDTADANGYIRRAPYEALLWKIKIAVVMSFLFFFSDD